jgi:predicted metal-dependent peptidase
MGNRKPTDDQRLHHAAWMVTALDVMPYMDSVLFSLRLLDAPGLGTFAVDKHHRLYIDFDKVIGWGHQACAEALLHEAMHLIYDHADEAELMAVKKSERKMFNVCADAALNDDLRDAGCTTIEEIGVLPAALDLGDYETAGYYLTQLRARRENQPPPPPPPPLPAPPGSGAGGADGSDGPEDQDEDQDGERDAGEPYEGCGSASGSEPAPCELDEDDDLGGLAPAAGEGEHAIVQANTAQAIQSHAKSHGTMPAGLVTWADAQLAPPTIPWRQTLRAHIRRGVNARSGDVDQTYNRRSRRRHHVMLGQDRRIVFPGTYAPAPTLVCVRDTSGSVSDRELAEFTNEVVGIAKQLSIKGNDLQIMDVDAQVHSTKAFKGAETLIERSGHGGTDMCVGIDAALELRPTVIVVMTDGETPWPHTRLPRGIPLIVCLSSNPSTWALDAVPEWAHQVIIDPDI